ncbi:hypothetical protein [Pseudomonas poae]|uniref:hypothetical protein n=1 Tax=Pseudomonas poae TaxID=200451 RepID=UPI0014767744|nr:hypothetical protein [Pseudomonas poae]NMZ50151.1 hypothetical protein [Pseudomonas poae]
MMENSVLLEEQVPTEDLGCLSNQELMLLATFRTVSSQYQADVLRILKIFALATEM